jgi:hypothetical protein
MPLAKPLPNLGAKVKVSVGPNVSELDSCTVMKAVCGYSCLIISTYYLAKIILT